MSDDDWLSDHLFGETSEGPGDAAPRLPADPEAAERASQMQEIVARLRELPAEAWEGVEDPVSEAASSPAMSSRRSWSRSLAVVVAVAMVFAAGLAVGAAAWRHVRSRPDVHTTVALRPLGATGLGSGSAQLVADDRLRLMVSGLRPAGRGRFYEAWLMSSATRLIPLATFRTVNGHAGMQITLPAALTAYRYIDVSLQRVDGGPEHSGDSVLRGTTRQ